MAREDARSRRARNVSSGLMLLASLVALTISTRSLVGVPQQLGLAALSFVQRGFSAVSGFFSQTVASIAELRRLQDDHADLVRQVELMANQQRQFTELRSENERLRGLLKFQAAASYASIAGRIIAKDPENLYSTFVVNRGSAQGVRKNQAVVAYQDGVEGLVGRVVEVSRESCMVVPIYDATTFVAARLERSRYEGLVVGGGGDDLPLVLRYVKKRAQPEIQFGDLVITSGLQSLYPAGIAIARAGRIRSFDYLNSLEIDLEPVLDFSRLEYVFIIDAQGAASP